MCRGARGACGTTWLSADYDSREAPRAVKCTAGRGRSARWTVEPKGTLRVKGQVLKPRRLGEAY
jgi:hypothetical protein